MCVLPEVPGLPISLLTNGTDKLMSSVNACLSQMELVEAMQSLPGSELKIKQRGQSGWVLVLKSWSAPVI